jgi:hypothetical protein
MTTRDLLTETFQDLTILSPNEPLSETDAAFGLQKLTRLFDSWNAERAGVYANSLTTYTLTPNLSPHTIGPAGSPSPTFTVSQRPVTIDGANLVITGGAQAIHVPLNLRDDQWWSGLTVPALATSIPTDLYYSADWPLGSLYLYPVPTSAYGLELLTRIVLANLALDDTVSMPPGYRDATILTLGEMIAPTYSPAVPNPAAAAKARARIFANNDSTPALHTRDSGMPSAGRGGGWFDWRAGIMRP